MKKSSEYYFFKRFFFIIIIYIGLIVLRSQEWFKPFSLSKYVYVRLGVTVTLCSIIQYTDRKVSKEKFQVDSLEST